MVLIESANIWFQAELVDFQWLYNASGAEEGCSKLLCTRHDVDGLLWGCLDTDEAKGEPSKWRHLATLQAFGYVLASKRNHRFVASPPTNLALTSQIPFVAVADTARHVYVYWQPGVTGENSLDGNRGTELRRRKTDAESGAGSQIVHVAWQQVISLPEADEIIGFVVTRLPAPACLVATRSCLFLIFLKE